MTRISRTALAAGAAALATGAALATTGSAQAPATSLHLVAHSQNRVGFFPHGRPKQGARIGFGDKISGDDTGIDRGVCTIIGGKSILCNVQVQLSKGTLSAQALLPQTSHNTPVAITGGTGAYNGARGTAIVNDTGKNSSTIDVTLVQ